MEKHNSISLNQHKSIVQILPQEKSKSIFHFRIKCNKTDCSNNYVYIILIKGEQNIS